MSTLADCTVTALPAVAGGTQTGYSPVNPARVLSPSLVFDCHWDATWVYLLAHVTAVVAAALLVLALYGQGPHYQMSRAQGHAGGRLVSGRQPADRAGCTAGLTAMS
jgi:hypothetical protein